MSSRSREKHTSSCSEFWTVINELPSSLPISTAELEVLERYFSDLIDECLKPQIREGKTIDHG